MVDFPVSKPEAGAPQGQGPASPITAPQGRGKPQEPLTVRQPEPITVNRLDIGGLLKLPELPPDNQELDRQRLKQNEEATFMASYRLALRENPDTQAEAQRIAQELGKPAELIATDMETAREMVKRRALNYRKFEQENPNLLRGLKNYKFALVAHDDLDNLAVTETLGKQLGRSWDSGRMVNERGYIGVRAALGLATDEERGRLAEIGLLRVETKGFLDSAAELAGQMVDTTSKAAGAATLAALPVAALSGPASPITAGGTFTSVFMGAAAAQGAMIEGGNQYLDMIDRGIPEPTAKRLAFGIYAPVAGALEAIGAKYFFAPIKATAVKLGAKALPAALRGATGGSAFREAVMAYAKSVTAETVTEMGQQAAGIATHEWARAISRPDLAPQSFGSMIEEVLDVGVKTAKGMAILGIPGPAASYVAGLERAQVAAQRANTFKAAVENAKKGKLAERAPGHFSWLVGEVVRDTPVENVYLDARKVAQVLQQLEIPTEDFAKVAPEAAAELEAQAAAGGDIVIPTGDYLAKVARSDLHVALEQHVRLDPDDPSAAEIEEAKPLVKNIDAEIQAQVETATTFKQSARAVELAILQRIGGAVQEGKLDIDQGQRRTAAAVMRAYMEQLALNTGVTPEQAFANNNVTVSYADKKAADQTVQQFAGKRAKRAPKTALRKAIAMRADGTDPQGILDATGWTQGKDGYWRFEIPDDGATLKVATVKDITSDMLLPDVMDHPALFKAYPQLARVNVRHHASPGRGATFRKKSFITGEGRGGNAEITLGDAMEPEFMLSAILHEVQHAIQGYEGFSSGADFNKFGIDAYKRVSGEVEARNTQKRQKMTKEERRASLPESTEDIHRNFQTVAYGGEIYTLNQEGEQEARASVDLSTLAVALHKKADVSSLLHEFSHTFLQIHLNVVAQQLADPEKIGNRRMQEDAETLLDWFGIASEAGSLQEKLAVWQAMTLDQQRKHHETFAYNFENYLFSAEAPSLKLEGVFRRFAKWLRRIYRDVRTRLNDLYKSQFGTDLPALTPEVRTVFDRMLAAEEDIAQAEAVRNVVPTFQTVEEFVAAGRTEAEWGDYQAALVDAHDAAVLDLTRASLRQMKWLEGARGRALKKLQSEGKAERAIIRDQVGPEVEAQPVYRLRKWLRTGKFVDETGLQDAGEIDPNHKLRREDVEAMNLGEAETKALDTHLSRSGQPADIVGRLFGYESGEAMVRELLAAPVLKDAIEAAVDQRMMVEFAEFTPGTPQHQEAIERALHNEARARFVAVEMKFLMGATQPVRVMVAAARMAARARLDRMAVNSIRPRDFAVAEARAAREAMKAVKDGDSIAAIDAKRRQLLQSQLAREAIKARKEIQDGLREAHQFRQSDTRLAKTRDVNLVAVGRAILAAFKMGPSASKAMPHLERVKEYNPTLYAELAPIVARATEAAAHYKTISLAEFREVIDTIKSLWWNSKREREMLIGGKRVSRDEIKAKLIAQFAKRGFAAPVGADRSPTRKQKALRSFGSIRAGLRHVESWAVEMDGGQPGDVHRYLFLPLRDKFTDYLAEKNERVKEFHRRIHALKLSGVQIDAPSLGYTFKGKAQLLGALLHAGNESNLEKNLLSRNWAIRLPDGTIDSSKWWKFIQEQADRGTITKADLEFVQWVWDQYESLLPRAQDAHFENYGRYFDRIPARSFSVKVGGEVVEVRGGYVPAKPDVDHPGYQAPELNPEGDGVFETSRDFQGSRMHASTGKGFTVDRTKIIRALSMDLQMHEVAMDEELRFIHMQRVGRDLGALLHDKELRGVLNQVDPDIVQETFYPWLRDTLQNRIMQPGLNKNLTQSLVFLRRNTGAALMFANVSNALMQLTGIGASLSIVKLKHMRASAARFLGGSSQMATWIVEKSDFMRLRLHQQIGQIIDDIDVVTNPTWLGKTQDWINRHAYFMQAWIQNPVDIITWGGAYDQAIVDGASEVEAVQAADSAVRRSQGSGTAADVSKFERGSPGVRLIMQFSTFWLSALNLVMERPTAAAKARTAALLIGIVGITAGAISQAMRGGWDDEDEDGALWDDVTGWAFGEALQTTASIGAPVVGPAFLRLMSGPSAGRLSFGATIGQLERAGRVFSTAYDFAVDPEREFRGSDIKDIGSFVSLATGIPFSVVAKPAAFAREVQRGNVDPGGIVESVAGALIGRTK